MLQPQKFTTVAQQPSRTLALTSDALRCSTSEARAKARAFVHLRGKMYIGYFDEFGHNGLPGSNPAGGTFAWSWVFRRCFFDRAYSGVHTLT